MKVLLTSGSYKGVLAIGDPHLEGRIPGFRKDNYPWVILEKLRWALDYAAKERLLPLILGDLFHLPRNNPNWLLVEVMRLLDREIFCIYGNHDVHEDEISDDDSLSVIIEAGRAKLLDNDTVVHTKVNGQAVIIGGTPWGKWFPNGVDEKLKSIQPRIVIWLAHHNIIVPGYEEQGSIKPRELPGIDLVINGHIHRCLSEVKVGATLWLTPGNISRRARSDATKEHKPSVLRIDVKKNSLTYQNVQVPHKPFDEVFYEAVIDKKTEMNGSAFIAGLAELQARRTETGAGLQEFLEKNLHQFDADVAQEIRKLAKEVIGNE